MRARQRRFGAEVNNLSNLIGQFELDEEDLKEIRSAANGGFALGNPRFKDEISAMLGRRVERLRQRLRQRASQSGWSVPFAAEIAW